MKYRIAKIVLMVLLSIAVLISCGGKRPDKDPASDDNSHGSEDVLPNTKEDPNTIEFDDQYAWCYAKEKVENGVYIVRSADELNSFCEQTKETYHFWEIPQPNELPNFYHIGFHNAVTKYDSAYFEDSILVMVYKASSGRCRFGVTEVIWENENLEINIEKRVAGDGYTDDIKEWIIFVELPKRANVASEENITVDFSTVTSYEQDRLDKIDKERLQEYFERMGITEVLP